MYQQKPQQQHQKKNTINKSIKFSIHYYFSQQINEKKILQ